VNVGDAGVDAFVWILMLMLRGPGDAGDVGEGFVNQVGTGLHPHFGVWRGAMWESVGRVQ